MYSNSSVRLHKNTTLSSVRVTEKASDLPQVGSTPTHAWIAAVRQYIKKSIHYCYATHLIAQANHISCQANEYFDAARDNFEISRDLNPDDENESQDLASLIVQADEYRSRARQLQGEAELLRTKAKQLCNR